MAFCEIAGKGREGLDKSQLNLGKLGLGLIIISTVTGCWSLNAA